MVVWVSLGVEGSVHGKRADERDDGQGRRDQGAEFEVEVGCCG